MVIRESTNTNYPKKFSALDDDLVCIKAGRDLTYEAQWWQGPQVLGREEEINKILTILSHRGMRNIILTGDPGVGKTALIAEVANRIAKDQVPPHLQKNRIIQTTFSDLWASVGDSDNWAKYFSTLKTLLREVKEYNAILFMDEIHTIFAHTYSMSYLRPRLASGEITIIGATTDHEYYTFIQRDRATARRFQVFRVPETDASTTKEILKSSLEKDRSLGVELASADILDYLVSLTNAYIPYQFQPSKALGLIEETIVNKQISGDISPISKDDIRKSVCRVVGIPEEAISAPKKRLEAMEEVLNAHILGQQEAIGRLCRRLFISKAAMSVTPDRPDGVFLLAGPTGVGKTELAKALAAYINGSEKDLIRVDMSGLSEPGSIYTLLGVPGRDSMDDAPQNVPPLTRQLRARPYSVLLLDEIEKAHRSIHLLFLHAFDTGRLFDNLGNEIYLGNTIVIMTTNVGFSVRQPIIGMPGSSPEKMVREQEEAVLKSIKENFPPEFLGRIDEILFFKPLTPEIMRGFVGQKLHQLEKITGKRLETTDAAIALLCDKGFSPEYGARDLNRAIDALLGYKLALFKFSVDWDKVRTLRVDKMPQSEELEISSI